MTEVTTTPRRNLPNRSTDDRVVAGVCAGLARAVGVDPPVVRIAAIVLGITGTGALLYLIGWAVLPSGPTPDRADDDTPEVRRGLGLVLIVLGVVLAQEAVGAGLPPAIVWPVVVVGIGVGVVVWQVQPQLRATRSEAFRIAAGIVVVGTGITALIAGNLSLKVIRSGILATSLVLGGVALIVGPWIAVLMRDRADERRRRLHADARADMAAHLHDSVLQTFALIQRTDDPRVIAQLARQQERELRRWLYADSDDPAATTLKNSVDRIAGVVEDRFAVAVEQVVVGDIALDTTLEALMGAMGEAITNAAKWSGCDQVSVYAEVEDDGVRVFVRDTGVGFDPGTVAEDRLGLRESIVGRMERVGGTVDIRSARGVGTEVELFAPLVGAGRRDTVLTMAAAPPRVVLVDDHQMFRSGVRSELGDRVTVVAEADDIATAVAVIEQWSPDVVLLDVHLPSGTGREVIEAVDAAGVDTRFLALSVSDAAEDVIDVVRAGARGYVTKSISAADLVDAIIRVSEGDAVFSPRLAGFVLDAFASGPAAAETEEVDTDLDALTTREKEVLRHLARGYTYKEIAQQLTISVKTVETHASAVLRKLQLSNRHELSRWAAARRIW